MAAGAAFTLAAGNLALIAYLDALAFRYETYVWLINGPAPFDQFGGGPFQLWFHVAFALAIGGLTGAGAALLAERLVLAGLAAVVAALGVLAGPGQLLAAVGF